MEEFFVLLILLVVACVVCGPIALVIAVIALKKLNEITRELFEKRIPAKRPMAREAPERKPEPAKEPVVFKETPKPAEDVISKAVEDVKQDRQRAFEAYQKTAEQVREEEKEALALKKSTLEQRIGTKWVLIAGVITVIVGVAFFLKYMYDNNLIGPLGRVVIVAVAGFIALAVGEVTRRRSYDIVAKGVTALGFATLYAAVFAAQQYYGLIGPITSFLLASIVTAAAMIYAVGLDEILIAFLSLLGGFLTPVIVSTGGNLPMPLFTFVLILSIGAMLCAYYRKWPAVNFIAFAGTFILYSGWFEKFYRPAMRTAETAPKQITVALGWLGIFFVLYLVLLTLYELAKKVKAKKEDALLILANASVVFYFLWTILFKNYQTELAFCSLGLSAAHLGVMALVIWRCKDDLELRQVLLAIGLVFLTIAVPLYFMMNAITIAWAAEGLILIIIGLRYRSVLTQLGGGLALLLSCCNLVCRLPLHAGSFRFIFNPPFATWCFVVAVILLCHILYRRIAQSTQSPKATTAQVLYNLAIILFFVVVSMEWYSHCKYNLMAAAQGACLKGQVIILSLTIPLLVLRPVCPKGILSKIIALIFTSAGSMFIIINFYRFHTNSFIIFANMNFLIVLLFVAALLLSAWLLYQNRQKETDDLKFAAALALAVVFVLWIMLTEEIYLYWYCRNRFAQPLDNWEFLAQMYISVMWALYGAGLMIVGFWRKISTLRYISISLFALLLLKIFVWDTRRVENVYRIAAFLAAGLTLVAISYLYQFLRKKGFFDIVLGDKNRIND
ncbi:DUF2339 domain-containing protein [Planctomycetota bacterium]